MPTTHLEIAAATRRMPRVRAAASLLLFTLQCHCLAAVQRELFAASISTNSTNLRLYAGASHLLQTMQKDLCVQPSAGILAQRYLMANSTPASFTAYASSVFTQRFVQCVTMVRAGQVSYISVPDQTWLSQVQEHAMTFMETHKDIVAASALRNGSDNVNDMYNQLVTLFQEGAASMMVYNPILTVDLFIMRLFTPLNAFVAKDTQLDWDDVMLPYRKYSTSMGPKIVGLPIDGQVTMMYYRKDILQAAGLQPPETWEEVVAVARTLNGTDFNKDGIPDYSLCMDFSVGCISLWPRAILAQKTQHLGTSQGSVFNILRDTKPPYNFQWDYLAASEAGWEAYDIFLQLVGFVHPIHMLGMNSTQMTCNYDVKLYTYGACALTFSATRLFKELSNVTRFNLAAVTAIELLPGSHTVLNRTSHKLMPCDSILCPYGTQGRNQLWINRAPVSSYPGYAVALQSNTEPQQLQSFYELISTLSSPKVSQQIVLNKDLNAGPFRKSHLDLESWVRAGYPRALSTDFLRVVSASMLDNNNMVLDARGLAAGAMQMMGTYLAVQAVVSRKTHMTQELFSGFSSVLSLGSNLAESFAIDPNVMATLRLQSLQAEVPGMEILSSDLAPAVIDQIVKLQEWCMRSLLTKHGGYECSHTNSEYIAAFHTPDSALQFTIQAQLLLMKMPWPEALLNTEAGGIVTLFAQSEDPMHSRGGRGTEGEDAPAIDIRSNLNTAAVGAGSGRFHSMLQHEPSSGFAWRLESQLSVPNTPARPNNASFKTWCTFFDACKYAWMESDDSNSNAVMAFRGLKFSSCIHCENIPQEHVHLDRQSKTVQYTGPCQDMLMSMSKLAQPGMVLLSHSTYELLPMELLWKAIVVMHYGVFSFTKQMPDCNVYQVLDYSLTCRMKMFKPVRSIHQCGLGSAAAPLGEVTIVFAYIVGVSALMSWNAEVALAAIKMFQREASHLLFTQGGYQVEAAHNLMLCSFKTCEDAVLWCLACQQQLMELNWPPPLLEHELGEAVFMEEEGDDGTRGRRLLFRGLRTKMGCDRGELLGNLQPITGRITYRGRVMNRASRIASQATTGQVLCSGELWRALKQVGANTMHGLVGKSLGSSKLKGVTDEMELVHIMQPNHTDDFLQLWSTVSGLTASNSSGSPDSGYSGDSVRQLQRSSSAASHLESNGSSSAGQRASRLGHRPSLATLEAERDLDLLNQSIL